MAEPPLAPVVLKASVARLLAKVYDPCRRSPWLKRLFRLTSSALYQEEPADSITCATEGLKPSKGTRSAMLLRLLVVTPRMGLVGLAMPAWFTDRWRIKCVPRAPEKPTSRTVSLESSDWSPRLYS